MTIRSRVHPAFGIPHNSTEENSTSPKGFWASIIPHSCAPFCGFFEQHLGVCWIKSRAVSGWALLQYVTKPCKDLHHVLYGSPLFLQYMTNSNVLADKTFKWHKNLARQICYLAMFYPWPVPYLVAHKRSLFRCLSEFTLGHTDITNNAILLWLRDMDRTGRTVSRFSVAGHWL